MDEVTKPGNWRAFRWIEEGLVRLDLHADEKQYYLTNAGAEYCETLLEAYESEPEQMAHIGEVITYLVNNKD